jgi:hypothetical protein
MSALHGVHPGPTEDPNLSVAGEEDPGAALDLPVTSRASQPLAGPTAGLAPLNPFTRSLHDQDPHRPGARAADARGLP